MSDYRDVLERSRAQYRPQPDGFERLRRRRDRKRRNERIAAAALVLILFAAAVGAVIRLSRSEEKQIPLAPTVTTVQITDPEGDALIGIGYVDIVSAAVSKNGGTFTFAVSLSAAIPATVEVPEPFEALGYEFCLDTDPYVSPVGYPFAASSDTPCEFIVDVIVRGGGRVEGLLIDRRPRNEGQDAVTSAIPVTLEGEQILTSVSVAALEDPGSFTWVLYTTELTLPLGNDRWENVDEAPDLLPAPWPSA